MENRTAGDRGWGLAEATRALVDNAGPADVERRDPQVDRAVTAFLAQPAGSVALDDARADQLIILADHFGVDEAYFVDPAVARSVGARGRHRARQPADTAAREFRSPLDAPPIAGAAVSGPSPRRGRMAVAAVAIAVLAGAIGGGLGYRVGLGSTRHSAAPANPEPAAGRAEASTALGQVVDNVLPSVAQVRVRSGNKEAVGSGIVLTPDGVLLVSDHVIASGGHGGQVSVAFADGVATRARVLGRNPASDLAVLAADNVHGLIPVKPADPGSVRVGERVVAVGPLLTRGGVIAGGVVSALDRTARSGGVASPAAATFDAIRTDAAVSLDNSGAPLVDPHGMVIGVETVVPGRAGAPNAGAVARLASAIPITQALAIAEQLVYSSSSVPTVLGLRVGVGGHLAVRDEPRGAPVVAVVPGSPASAAALKAGDTVVEVNGRAVSSGEQLAAATKALAPHEIVTVRLSDGRSVRLSLDRAPVSASQVSRRQPCAHACTALPDVPPSPHHLH